MDTVGRRPFQRQLYQCLISQTLWMKGQIESMRSTNSYGALIWQLGEVWPTGGWGLLEYGFGRWKPLMYLLRQSLFRDVAVACGEGGACYVRNDAPNAMLVARVRAQVWSLNQTEPMATWWWSVEQEDRRTTFLSRFQLPQNWTQLDADVILLDVFDIDTQAPLVDTSAFLWKTPAESAMTRKPRLQIVRKRQKPQKATYRKEFQVVSDRLALYVVLSTQATGRFDWNAFHVRPGEPRTVVFHGMEKNDTIDVDLLEGSLRVEHLLKYVPNAVATS